MWGDDHQQDASSWRIFLKDEEEISRKQVKAIEQVKKAQKVRDSAWRLKANRPRNKDKEVYK